MKKQFVLMVVAALFSITAVNAQGGGQRMTPEERTKATIEKMAALKMDDATKAKADVIIADFYNAQQKAMDEMRASGSFDRDAFTAKRKELAEARDKKLKEILTEAQMKQWVDEVEPSTRPQRPAGGGGTNGGGGK